VQKTQHLVADRVQLAQRKVNTTASTVLQTVGDIANIPK
jgi:hypothetical protein